MNFEQSPLFEPVLWQGDGFEILNELLLPGAIEYIHVSDVGQAVDAVREMKTRAFGQVLTFLYSGALLGRRYQGNEAMPLEAEIERMTQCFSAARPTFDFDGLRVFFPQWLRNRPTGASPGAWIETRAREMAAAIMSARHARAKRTAAVLPERTRLLTHCNISGELVAVAHYCKTLGKELSVIATETRPYLQGTRLTAWELARAGVRVSVIPDCAIAQVMADGKVQAVIVGSDRCARNGDIINKVGTYSLAHMARQYQVPFYALVQYPGALENGAGVEIEERPAEELLRFQGQMLLAEGSDQIHVRYPAFDVTPARLVTSLIDFEGQWSPESFQAKHQGQGKPAKNGDRRKRAEGRFLLVYGVPQANYYKELADALQTESAESVLVPEMRPELWGAHCLAGELLRRRIPTTLISDNMMGTLFSQGEISRLYLCSRGSPGQAVTGITGSLLAYQLARAHGVPIELLESKDVDAPRDRDVSTFLGQRVLPPGVAIEPLRTEIIPASLVAGCH